MFLKITNNFEKNTHFKHKQADKKRSLIFHTCVGFQVLEAPCVSTGSCVKGHTSCWRLSCTVGNVGKSF